MAALTEDLTEFRKEGDLQSFDMIASDIIFNGALVQMVVSTGNIQPLVTTDGTTVEFVGIAMNNGDNSSGAAGDVAVKIDVSGAIVKLVGSGLTQTDVGSPAYGTDDQTFTTTQGTNTQLLGIITEVISATSARVKLRPYSLASSNEVVAVAGVYTPTNDVTDRSWDANAGDITLTATITDSSGGVDSGDDIIALVTNTAALTDSTTGTANTTLVPVTAVNGSGATTAQEGVIDDNFADLAAQMALQRTANIALLAAIAQLAAKMNTTTTGVTLLESTLLELSDVLATLVTDLQASNIIQ